MNPGEVIASRTSPTNIGMALLADLAAYDFGYISVACLLDRTRKTFGTMSKMEHYRGHLFNWYDTQTLQPLAPLYVSTVDSGNLAGHLYVLGSGFRELVNAKILPRRICDGLADTLGVPLEEASSDIRPATDRSFNGKPQATAVRSGEGDAGAYGLPLNDSLRIDGNVKRSLERQIEALERCPYQIGATQTLLLRLIEDSSAAASEKSLLLHPELHWWLSAFVRACTDHLQELQRLHAVASASRCEQRDGAADHGASCWHEFAVAGISVAE